MGKLGDLIVRLKLQYKDYEKGLKEAEKKSKGFSANLSKAFSAVKLGVVAIGAVAVFMGKQLIEASNEIGDAWNEMVSGMKGAWQSVLADMANYKPDFSSLRNFFKNEWSWIKKTFFNAKEAGEAAAEMAKAFDAEFELENSLKIQRARIKGQLADLQVELMNANLSPEARLAAANKYKALLEPLYEAEIRIRKDMLDAAVKSWLAGSGVDASVSEVVDFFANYGIDSASTAAKYPELAKIYEKRKGDKTNQPIYDAITKLETAESGLADELKRVNRTVNSITGQMEDTVEEVRKIDELLPKLNNISAGAQALTVPDIIPDDWLTRNREKIDAAVEEAMRLQQITDEINKQFNDAVVNSLSGATQALVDCVMGIEGADASQVLAALLRPFAQTMISLGEMLLAEGVAVEAFQTSLKTLQGAPAIAAGLSLIALGSALSAGIQSLAGSTSSSAGANGTASTSTSSNSNLQTQQEITVHVIGEISGDKIILAGQKTLNKWSR